MRPAVPEAKRPDCPAKVDDLYVGSNRGLCRAEATRIFSLMISANQVGDDLAQLLAGETTRLGLARQDCSTEFSLDRH